MVMQTRSSSRESPHQDPHLTIIMPTIEEDASDASAGVTRSPSPSPSPAATPSGRSFLSWTLLMLGLVFLPIFANILAVNLGLAPPCPPILSDDLAFAEHIPHEQLKPNPMALAGSVATLVNMELANEADPIRVRVATAMTHLQNRVAAINANWPDEAHIDAVRRCHAQYANTMHSAGTSKAGMLDATAAFFECTSAPAQALIGAWMLRESQLQDANVEIDAALALFQEKMKLEAARRASWLPMWLIFRNVEAEERRNAELDSRLHKASAALDDFNWFWRGVVAPAAGGEGKECGDSYDRMLDMARVSMEELRGDEIGLGKGDGVRLLRMADDVIVGLERCGCGGGQR